MPNLGMGGAGDGSEQNPAPINATSAKRDGCFEVIKWVGLDFMVETLQGRIAYTN
jgi:hypothetical protein